ncbi:MAG: FlgD immunoglobulin-like domain containing protein [Candidatus Latescibacterota bacterium]
MPTRGRVRALVVYAKFSGEEPQERTAPAHAAQLFDRQRPGSLAHFYHTMSFGQLTVEGTALPTAVREAGGGAPRRFGLEPNQPNPFNGTTTITYGVAQAGPVRLAVFDLAGQQVRELVGTAQQAGRHQAVWDGRDARGREVATGVYLVRLQAGMRQQTRRCLLLR